MATHSSILAWKSPWTEESGGLNSMGLHDWACVHEGGGRWVGSNKVVELKKKKSNIKETKIMASSPITSWQIDKETVETVTDFIFLGSRITADGDRSRETKRRLLAPWKKSYDPPRQHIRKQRHYWERSTEEKLWFFQRSCMDVRAGP